jgi:AcrR family transcriptional regulator
MARTRAALLLATGECLARYGVRKTTMVDVAAKSRVAKATLYNHFRTKEDLLAAYVEERVGALVAAAVETAAREGIEAALQEVVGTLAADPALRRAAQEEPALLAPLAVPGSTRTWQLARQGTAAVLDAGRASSGDGEVDLVLRWCLSQLWWPGADAAVLVGALGAVPEPVVVLTASAPPRPSLGWPQG